jgi:hypothetical protein
VGRGTGTTTTGTGADGPDGELGEFGSSSTMVVHAAATTRAANGRSEGWRLTGIGKSSEIT